MAVEVWIQPALFPKYNTEFYAYEMESIGGRWWEVFDDGDTMIGYYEPDEFLNFLDFARSINYDVLLNTQESWYAMEESFYV